MHLLHTRNNFFISAYVLATLSSNLRHTRNFTISQDMLRQLFRCFIWIIYLTVTHVLNIVWWIPQNFLDGKIYFVSVCLLYFFSCQYRKLKSRFMFFTSCKTQCWCGAVRSQQILLFPPISSPAAGPKQPHVWNCVIHRGLARRISRAVRKRAETWVWHGEWDALRQRPLPRQSFGLTQCDPVTQNLCQSSPVLLSPALLSLHACPWARALAEDLVKICPKRDFLPSRKLP